MPESDNSPAQVSAPRVLERDVPLSRSILWQRQREYYAQRGARVWADDAVPNYITNNPFIAEVYARIVFCFMNDCRGAGLAPLRVLELGAGTGKFAYLCLQRLRELMRRHGADDSGIRYCMADCSADSLEAWRANERLAPFVADGTLSFELWTAGEEQKLRFLEGEAAPLVVIANYVFDSLPQDVFVVEGGRLFEALVTTSSPGHQATPSQFKLDFRNVEKPAGGGEWEEVLQSYRQAFSAVTFTFPTQALHMIDGLRERSDGNVFFLTADKGVTSEDELARSQAPAALEFHSTHCFSQMVNFDAIARYFRRIGGKALLPEKHSTLRMCAFVHGTERSFPEAERAYDEAELAFGPDDLFTLFAWLNAHMEEMTVLQILAALRLTRWDPTAFMRLFPVLSRQLSAAGAQRGDLRTAILRTWENHYPVTAADNALAFQCGAVLLSLAFYGEAEAMFRVSQRVLGPSAATSFNLGLCAQGLHRDAEALALMREACALDPDFELARAACRKLETKASG